MLGNRTMFILEVRGQFSQTEQETIRKCHLGDTIIFDRFPWKEPSVRSGAPATAHVAQALMDALQVQIYARDLVDGRTFECKDIREMIIAEDAIKDASELFALVLKRAMTFGGEEIFDYEAPAAR